MQLVMVTFAHLSLICFVFSHAVLHMFEMDQVVEWLFGSKKKCCKQKTHTYYII